MLWINQPGSFTPIPTHTHLLKQHQTVNCRLLWFRWQWVNQITLHVTIYTANVRHKKTTFLHEHFLVLMDCHKGSSIVHNKNGTVMTFCRVLKCIPINTSYKPDHENMYIEPTLFIGPSINTWKWLFLWGKRVHFTVSYYIIIILSNDWLIYSPWYRNSYLS